MALNRRLDQVFPGTGVSVRQDTNWLRAGVSLSGNSVQQTTIPSSGTLAPTTTVGSMRIKIYGGGGTSPTLTDLFVTAGDGTNTITIPQSAYHPNSAPSLITASWLDFFFEYLFDLASSGGGGAASGQLSATIGGANVFTVNTTLGGTSPTAKMDVELVPLI